MKKMLTITLGLFSFGVLAFEAPATYVGQTTQTCITSNPNYSFEQKMNCEVVFTKTDYGMLSYLGNCVDSEGRLVFENLQSEFDLSGTDGVSRADFSDGRSRVQNFSESYIASKLYNAEGVLIEQESLAFLYGDAIGFDLETEGSMVTEDQDEEISMSCTLNGYWTKK